MRTALLALVLLAQPTAAEYYVAPPRYEHVPCGQIDAPPLWVIDADGTYRPAVRLETSGQTVRVVGYEPRLFCSGMD
jgi:hypothetical protein